MPPSPVVPNKEDIINCALVKEVVEEYLNLLPYDVIVHRHYSTQNKGCRDSIIYAITYVLKRHESVIIIEDDIITSPAFLLYMNTALDYYKNMKSVHSISGYSPAPSKFITPVDYSYDVFVSPRLFGWGWGTWRDRWDSVDWSMNSYEEFIGKPEMIEAFNRGGDDLTPMLIDEIEGRSSAWDILFVFDQFKKHMVSIVPCHSYTKNIGLDGSGTHCYNIKDIPKELILNINQNPRLIDILYLDKRIINLLHSAYSMTKRPFWQKIINYIVRKLGFNPPFKIKKRVYA